MQKVDVVILGLGAAALIATVLGVMLYEAGDRDLVFLEQGVTLDEQTGAVGTQPTTFTWDAPQNATGANLTADIAFTGRAVQGGTATVTLRIIGPDGSEHEQTLSMTIPIGSQGVEQEFTISHAWLDRPEDKRGDPEANEDAVDWDAPIQLEITVTPPADVPTASAYSFEATVSGTANAYYATIDAPDVETQ